MLFSRPPNIFLFIPLRAVVYFCLYMCAHEPFDDSFPSATILYLGHRSGASFWMLSLLVIRFPRSYWCDIHQVGLGKLVSCVSEIWLVSGNDDSRVNTSEGKNCRLYFPPQMFSTSLTLILCYIYRSFLPVLDFQLCMKWSKKLFSLIFFALELSLWDIDCYRGMRILGAS